MKRNTITSVWKLIAFLFIAIFAVYQITKDKDVSISDIDWQCIDRNCNITFEVENKRLYPVVKDIKIKALRESHGKYGSTSYVAGEKLLYLELESNEKRKIDEDVKVTSNVNRVTVNILNKSSS